MYRAAIFLLVSALLPSAHANPAYSISTPDTALTGMVSSTALTIRLGAPSSALLARAALKLNGADVTSQVHADGPGSMSGVVTGLQPGANVFELWSRNSTAPVGLPRAPSASETANRTLEISPAFRPGKSTS